MSMTKSGVFKGYIPSAVFYKGKCATCEVIKPLDEMVRREGARGVYRCIDCETEVTAWSDAGALFAGPVHLVQALKEDIARRKARKLLKLMRWAFG